MGKIEIMETIMFLFYQEISKEFNIPVDRILLAITDDGKTFQVYNTNQSETSLYYICDKSIPKELLIP